MLRASFDDANTPVQEQGARHWAGTITPPLRTLLRAGKYPVQAPRMCCANSSPHLPGCLLTVAGGTAAGLPRGCEPTFLLCSPHQADDRQSPGPVESSLLASSFRFASQATLRLCGDGRRPTALEQLTARLYIPFCAPGVGQVAWLARRPFAGRGAAPRTSLAEGEGKVKGEELL